MSTAAPEPIPIAEVNKLIKAAGWVVTTEPVAAWAVTGACQHCSRPVGKAHTRGCLQGKWASGQGRDEAGVVADDTRVAVAMTGTTALMIREDAHDIPSDLGLVWKGQVLITDHREYRKLVKAAGQQGKGKINKGK